MIPQSAVDFLGLETQLDDEERLVRDSVRRFVEEQVRPIIVECHRQGRFPRELIPELGRLDILGAGFHGHGLPGLGGVAYGLIMEELEKGDSGIRSFVSVQNGLVIYPILAFGSEEQKSRWIPVLASGEAVGCFGLTEPDAGSNPGALRTRADKDGEGWVLSGSKQWITNGSLADVAVIWARTGEGIRGFLVESDTPGFTASDQPGKFSLRASITSELGLHECRVPASSLLPGTSGLKSALMCLNEARYGIAWGAIGAAMDCFETAVSYATERVQFGGRPIASHQLVQDKLVWMVTEITKARLLARQLAWLKDHGRLQPQQISLGKRNNVWMARECARYAREILGANGIVDDYPVIRHLLNLESVYTYEGTHDIHGLIIGEAITGISAFDPPPTLA